MNKNDPIIVDMKDRLKRYKTAVAMSKGKIPSNGAFRWPFFPGYYVKDPRNVFYWNGCIAELEAVLQALETDFRSSANTTVDQNAPLSGQSHGIRIKGHMGTWRVVLTDTFNGSKAYLLEHEQYGEMANHLLVDENKNILRRLTELGEYEDYLL